MRGLETVTSTLTFFCETLVTPFIQTQTNRRRAFRIWKKEI